MLENSIAATGRERKIEMKILVIGGVAAGTKAAAKWKRENRADQVMVITKSADISYAGCGLPYYVGGSIADKGELIVNTPQKYQGLTGVEVRTQREAVQVDPAAKRVVAKNLQTGEEESYGYDKLIVATGASAVKPPIPGVDLNGVFPMRAPQDAIAMRDYLDANGVKKAVVIGGGFIGLELAENLFDRGISVTVVELAPQILANVLDPEMAGYVKRHLQQKGIRVLTGAKAAAIVGQGKVEGVQTDSGLLPCGAVVLSAGIRPNTDFLDGTGVEMVKGAIVVDQHLATSVADIYAAGDCALVTNRLTGKAQWSPMGSSANLEGRTLAQGLNGEDKTYPGVLGTGVVKLPGLNAGRTGLTEAAAKEAGYDVETVVAVTDDKAHYYPGAAFFITKLLADRNTHQLLGVQVLGPGAVDKMVDIAVVGISMGLKLEDFENLDLAYAPPFSTAIHPFVQAVYVLENKLSGAMDSMTPAQYAAGEAEGCTVIDVNPQPTIRGARFVDLSKVDGPLEGIGKDEKLLLVCGRGKRAYFLQNRLKFYGYTNTLVLEGATTFNEVRIKAPGAAVPPEEVTRVKGLGFLLGQKHPRLLQRPGYHPQRQDHRGGNAGHHRSGGALWQRSGGYDHPVDNGDSAHSLRQHRASSGIFGGAWPGNRRHRLQSTSRGKLQGDHLPVWADRHLRSQRGNSRAVLSRLQQREAAPQIQDRRGRLSQQLRQARPERPGHYRTKGASHRPGQVPGLQGVPGGQRLSHQGAGGTKRQGGYRRQRLQPLRPLRGKMSL